MSATTMTKYTRIDVASKCKVYELETVSKEKAAKIAAMFTGALGKNGVAAEGHEPYPDPSLFTVDGVIETVESPYRRLFIAELDGEIVGGIIADALHELACEFNCMAVDKKFRGMSIGSLLVEGAKNLIDDCFFLSNITELVTHNLASQTAHIKHGYNRFLGFGYAHYPQVFFVDKPESVVWAGQLHGRLAKELRNLRDRVGNLEKLSDSEITELISRESRVVIGKASHSEKQLATELVKPRFVYLPEEYACLGNDILLQYADQIEFRINNSGKEDSGYGLDGKTVDGVKSEETANEAKSPSQSSEQNGLKTPIESSGLNEQNELKTPIESRDSSKQNGLNKFEVDFKPDYAHTYIDFAYGFDMKANQTAVQEAIDKVRNTPGKRFIRATIKANHPSCVDIANFLKKQGFAFHSILPLYHYEASEDGTSHKFHDLLGMQWVCPEVVSKNPLPGETDSVIKVYGYPANLTGKIVSLIRSEVCL